MSLKKLYEIEFGGELSFAEAQKTNEELSLVSLKDIPKDQLSNVREYIEAAFAADSIMAEQIQPLTELLEHLRAYA